MNTLMQALRYGWFGLLIVLGLAVDSMPLWVLAIYSVTAIFTMLMAIDIPTNNKRFNLTNIDFARSKLLQKRHFAKKRY